MAKTYSLFVDESGSCGWGAPPSVDTSWVIAGVFAPCEPKELAEAIQAAFAPIGRRFGLDEYDRPNGYHMTDIRKTHSEAANLIATELLTSLSNCDVPITMLAVTNDSRATVMDANGDGDQTYRSMVMDLVALVEASIPNVVRAGKLIVTTASRTSKVLGLSDMEELRNQIEPVFGSAFEVGLVSRGLVELLGAKNRRSRLVLTTQKAYKSWPLAAADVVANTTFHQSKPDLQQYLSTARNAGRYFLFESMGSYNERRSRVAERDRDYGSALYWMSLDVPEGNGEEAYYARMVGLFQQSRSTVGAVSARATIEILIEKLDQQFRKTPGDKGLHGQLVRLQRGLCEFADDEQRPEFYTVLMRFQNYILWHANHLGNVVEAEAIVADHAKLKTRMSFSPENFDMLLTGEFHEVETAINRLDFGRALELAKKYVDALDSCKVAWELVTGEQPMEFERSASWIKGNTTLARAQILAAEYGDATVLDAAADRLDLVLAFAHEPSDKSRARCLKASARLKARRLAEAMEIASEIMLADDVTLFDLYVIARVAAEAVVAGTCVKCDFPKGAYDWIIQWISDKPVDGGYPAESVYLELGHLAHCIEEPAKVVSAHFMKASAEVSASGGESPIDEWSQVSIDFHIAKILNGKPDAMLRALVADAGPECERVAERAKTIAAEVGVSLLAAVRSFGPV